MQKTRHEGLEFAQADVEALYFQKSFPKAPQVAPIICFQGRQMFLCLMPWLLNIARQI